MCILRLPIITGVKSEFERNESGGKMRSSSSKSGSRSSHTSEPVLMAERIETLL